MSLETEIATLRQAVEKLTKTLENQQFAPCENEKSAATEAQTAYLDASPDETEQGQDQDGVDPNEGGMTPTRKELTDIALGISRASKDAKPKIKAILEEHGAATITKLDDDHLYAVWEKLEALKGKVVS